MNYAKVTSVKEPFLTPDHVCVDKAANNGAKLFVGNRQKNFSEYIGHKTMYASSGNEHFFTKGCEPKTFPN